MALDIEDLTTSMETLLASEREIPAADLRAFQAKLIAAIASLALLLRGNRIIYANGVPAGALGMEGDMGVNRLTGDIYEFKAGEFAFLFNIVPRPGTGTPGTGEASFATITGQPSQNPALNAVILQLAAATTAQKSRLDNLVVGAPLALDTLAEIAAQLAADEQGAAAMLAAIQVLKTSKAEIGVFPDFSTSINVKKGTYYFNENYAFKRLGNDDFLSFSDVPNNTANWQYVTGFAMGTGFLEVRPGGLKQYDNDSQWLKFIATTPLNVKQTNIVYYGGSGYRCLVDTSQGFHVLTSPDELADATKWDKIIYATENPSSLRNSIRLTATGVDNYVTLNDANSAFDISLKAGIGNTITMHLPVVTTDYVGKSYSFRLNPDQVGKQVVIMGRYANTADNTPVVLATLNAGDVATASMLRVFNTPYLGFAITAFSQLSTSLTLEQDLTSNSPSKAPSVKAVGEAFDYLEGEIGAIVRLPKYTSADYGKVLGLTAAGVLAWVDPMVNLNFGNGLLKEQVTVDGVTYEQLNTNDAHINQLIEAHEGGVTPNPPVGHSDDVNNAQWFEVPAGETLELSTDDAAPVDYDGHVIDLADAVIREGYYRARVKARGINGPSQYARSLAFTKAATAPAKANLLAHTNNFSQPANTGWGCGNGNNQASPGFDGGAGTGVDQVFYEPGADMNSPEVNVAGKAVEWYTGSIYVKPFRVSNPSDNPTKLLRSYDREGQNTLDFDMVNLVVLNATGSSTGTIEDVSYLGGDFVGAFRLTHTYRKTAYDGVWLRFAKVDAGVGYCRWYGPMLNEGQEVGAYTVNA